MARTIQTCRKSSTFPKRNPLATKPNKVLKKKKPCTGGRQNKPLATKPNKGLKKKKPAVQKFKIKTQYSTLPPSTLLEECIKLQESHDTKKTQKKLGSETRKAQKEIQKKLGSETHKAQKTIQKKLGSETRKKKLESETRKAQKKIQKKLGYETRKKKALQKSKYLNRARKITKDERMIRNVVRILRDRHNKRCEVNIDVRRRKITLLPH
jgi:hypothetical protein